MDFRRLEAFCKVYELRSFSKAGQEIFLSQPTISAHVASLEEELGVRLFDRLGRTVMPTQAGEILYKGAIEVFSRLERVTGEIQLLRDKVFGELQVGCSSIPANYIMPELISRFLESYPAVNVHMSVADSEEILSHVHHGDLVLGVVGVRPERSDLASYELMHDELVIVGHPDLVVHGRPLDSDNFAAWPWVLREKGSGTRQAFEAALHRHGVQARQLRVTAHVDSMETVIQCVRAGLGISVMSRIAAEPHLERGDMAVVHTLPLSIERSFYLVHRDGRSFLPAVRFFMEFLKNSVAN